jgi:hypothetical protein
VKRTEEKITSFRTAPDIEKKLKKDLYRQNITKKDWLNSKINNVESQRILSIKNQEHWVSIPIQEYDQLLKSTWKEHASYICDRIMYHVKSQGKQITFESLYYEVQVFQELNNIAAKRYDLCCTDNDYEMIVWDKVLSDNYAKFMNELIALIISRTNEFTIISSRMNITQLEITIRKNKSK